jgi:hypothetical protein
MPPQAGSFEDRPSRLAGTIVLPTLPPPASARQAWISPASSQRKRSPSAAQAQRKRGTKFGEVGCSPFA